MTNYEWFKNTESVRNEVNIEMNTFEYKTTFEYKILSL